MSTSETSNVTDALSSSHQSGRTAGRDAADLTAWQRISRTLAFATTRVEPGEPVSFTCNFKPHPALNLRVGVHVPAIKPAHADT